MPPPVHVPMAAPAQQFDVAAALTPKSGIGPMVDRHGRLPSAVQHQAAPAAGAPTITRHEPPPASRPPDRRPNVQLVHQRVTTPPAHKPLEPGTIRGHPARPRSSCAGVAVGAKRQPPGAPLFPYRFHRAASPGASGGGRTSEPAPTQGFPAMGDPGLEPGTSSLSEKSMSETSGRQRPRKATKVLQKLADQDHRPKPPGSARTHPGGRGMDVLRRGWPGSIRGFASRRLGRGRDGLAGCRVPGGGRERSPDVARGVVPAVPCGAGTALRRA